MRPGDCTRDGNIVIDRGRLVSRGTVSVSLSQALCAYKHGWRIVPGSITVDRAPNYLLVHINRAFEVPIR